MIVYVLARQIYARRAGTRDVKRTEETGEEEQQREENKQIVSIKENVVWENAERNANNNDTKRNFTRL
jgi:hypothetical protein